MYFIIKTKHKIVTDMLACITGYDMYTLYKIEQSTCSAVTVDI